jgi:tRNA pseudouridine55 synthase
MSAVEPDELARVEKRRKQAVHGLFLLDKPLGMSSQQAVQKVKRLFNAEKAGHTGTLDPLATGLLPICLGAATKFSQLGLEADKAYWADVQWGVSTTTGDREGEVLRKEAVAFTHEQVDVACRSWTGEIEQTPPMYSALKVQGKALYEYARMGQVLERESRRVCIRSIAVLKHEDALQMGSDRSTLSVVCSKGTYIRTLAEDIGLTLGCGAHLAGLHRVGTGFFSIDQAYSLEQLMEYEEEQRTSLLHSPDILLGTCPDVRLQDEDAARFLSGLRRRIDLPNVPLVKVWGPQAKAFLGSGHIVNGELIPTRLLTPLEVQALIDLF